MIDELLVFIGGRYAGVARRRSGPDSRQVAFRYDTTYITVAGSTPLSLRMPVENREYEIGHWLDGLLPDQQPERDRWAAKQKAQAAEPMSLLATPVGLDCAGAVQFCRPGEEAAVHDRDSGVEWHTDTEIAAWARTARRGQRQQLGSQIRHSLGGWQTKVALHRVGDRWGTPFGDQPTTWILKPGVDPRPEQGVSWPDSDLVEHVTMSAARRLGLEAAHTTVERFAGERVLAVRRYDRYQHDDRWLRTHQEDFCQALNVPPRLKYQIHGGPSPEQIIDELRSESSDSDGDLARFVDALIFNWATGGMDGHAKNYSVLLRGEEVRLAPLYDLMTEIPYRTAGAAVAGLHTAMRIGTGYTLADADHRGVWELAASRYQLHAGQLADRAAHLLDQCPAAFGEVIDGLASADRQSPQLSTLVSDLQQRRDEVLNQLRAPTWASHSQQAPSPRSTIPQPTSQRPSAQPSPTARLSPPAAGETPQAPASSPVVCGAPTGVDKSCRRTLASAPCPNHPRSPGSKIIKARRKRR